MNRRVLHINTYRQLSSAMLDRAITIYDADTCSFAAKNGHLAVLQWARANGCPWDEDTCAYAAMNGHLAVLEWARANGCPWNEDTCAYAALNGHLAVLQWARANGCPWDEDVCVFATENGHLAVAQWARANAVDRRCKNCSKDDTELRYISELGASARLCERCAPSVTEILGCLVRVQGGGACTNCSARNALCACKRCTEQHLKTTVCCLRCILDAGSTSTCACPTVLLCNVD